MRSNKSIRKPILELFIRNYSQKRRYCISYSKKKSIVSYSIIQERFAFIEMA